MCDHLAIMEDGHICENGPSRELFERPQTRTGAVLTGCKNIANAEKISDDEVFVPSWGVTLKTLPGIEDGICAVGIRAHYFYENETANANPVTITERIEQPFEWIVKFRYPGQDPSSDPIWWRVAKSGKTIPDADVLGVAPGDVLPLKNGSPC